MFKVRLADLVIGIDNKYTYIENQCADYKTDADADFDISLSAAQIMSEAEGVPEAAQEMGYLESLAIYRAVSERLLDYDGFLLHSAAISVNGRGIAFAARSGTGKTTHIRLWKELLGSSVTVINGDKPLIRFIDGVPHAYGTPWAGKEGYNENTRAHLTDICFLNRATENSIVPMSKEDAVKRLLCQVYMPKNPVKKLKTFELMDLFMKTVNVWEIGCNMDISAAKTVYSEIFEEKKHES